MANLSDFVGFALTVTIRYKKETSLSLAKHFGSHFCIGSINTTLAYGSRRCARYKPLLKLGYLQTDCLLFNLLVKFCSFAKNRKIRAKVVS